MVTVRELNRRKVQVRGMPRRLAVAYILPQIVMVLLIIGIGLGVLRTWVALTKTGRTALTRHITALKSVIETAERQPSPAPQ